MQQRGCCWNVAETEWLEAGRMRCGETEWLEAGRMRCGDVCSFQHKNWTFVCLLFTQRNVGQPVTLCLMACLLCLPLAGHISVIICT